MHIIFFAHPLFLNHQSMPRFTNMLADGMKKRKHTVEIWSPQPKAVQLPAPKNMKKWLGYVDQFIIFPKTVRKRLKSVPEKTLFVFSDQALGPWVPLVKDRRHVIHCHDFLAQLSAYDKIKEHKTSWTGKKYQWLIRNGFRKGSNFVSVSNKTREDLHDFLLSPPKKSEMVYNGLNQSFFPKEKKNVQINVSNQTGINLNNGYILHVGGNQWYKNRIGVIDIYDSWRNDYNSNIPLILLGESPNETIKMAYQHSKYSGDIHFLEGIADELVREFYAGASALLFPSLEEGFGWPIAEAMASGCLVITTNKAPMTEVAGEAGFLIPRKLTSSIINPEWAKESAAVLNEVVTLPLDLREQYIENGLINAKRFDTEKTLNEIERVYLEIINEDKP